MNKPLTLFQKTLLSLVIALPVVAVIDLLLQCYFDISLIYGYFVAPWTLMALTSLYVFFSRRKIFAFVLFCIILTLPGTAVYNYIQDNQLGNRSAINGHYSIFIKPRGYSIIKDYGFAEKTIATKYSTVFLDSNSKTGVNPGHLIEILKETPDSLYIEINSGQYTIVDSLKKRSLWKKEKVDFDHVNKIPEQK